MKCPLESGCVADCYTHLSDMNSLWSYIISLQVKLCHLKYLVSARVFVNLRVRKKFLTKST